MYVLLAGGLDEQFKIQYADFSGHIRNPGKRLDEGEIYYANPLPAVCLY